MKRIRRPAVTDSIDERYRQGMEAQLSGETLAEFRRRYECLHPRIAGVRPSVDIALREMREDRVKGLPQTTSWRAA